MRHILYPIDFSARSLAASPFVEAMAKRFQADVTLFTVVQPITYAGMAEPGAAFYIDPEELRINAQNRLNTTLTKEFGGIAIKRVAEIGEPASSITGYAHAHDVDLIMMPTHGYGPFRRFLIGSVTAKVLHDARCPVWTGAHMEEPPILDHLSSKNILCAVDNTPKSWPLMEWAARYAEEAGGSLRLVHAVPGVQGWPGRQMDREYVEAVRQQAREQIAAGQKEMNVSAPLCIESGEVSDVVRDEARRHNADLIVIGRGVLHETLGRLRTRAYAIIQHAPCPVISV